MNSRNVAGVDDFVLLDDFTNENVFVDNLRIRYESDLIYTFIGPVLVSLNPYKKLGIYSNDYKTEYKNTDLFELPPHMCYLVALRYAIADNSYRTMLRENKDECILISGESGAGKTEASKYILEYIAATSSIHNQSIDLVKEKLLKSNSILENNIYSGLMIIGILFSWTFLLFCCLNFDQEMQKNLNTKLIYHKKMDINFKLFNKNSVASLRDIQAQILSIAVSSRLNLYQVPLQAKCLPIGQKRKRGQPSKTRPALQRQPSENSEYFAVNQDTLLPNPKPATLEPISRNKNAMNGIQPNQASQTIQVMFKSH
ncbi:unconventional myosin-Ic-like isoform X1 [Brachionus plicatilis]|uniref:Unconventional myosin-Ic-like isoform X1 n=1 Tax=Brachionus plicatilis TaxID=10195 RepID=A0A3M7RNK3_BRAPC|nr:unconventional myosin-Ic-like isoform X1 [Brachionus plicatilis]